MSDFTTFTQPVERRITRKLVEAIFSEPGRSVTVSNGVGRTGLILNAKGVYKHLASTGSDWITVYDRGEQAGSVLLIWGNEEDVISDYSDTPALRAIVEPLLDALV